MLLLSSPASRDPHPTKVEVKRAKPPTRKRGARYSKDDGSQSNHSMRSSNLKYRKLCIAGLDEKIQGSDLNTLMEGYGDVVDAVILVNRTKVLGMQRCGYVTFANEHDARYVLNLKPLRIMNKHVEVTFAIEGTRTTSFDGSNAYRSASSGLTTVRTEMQELLKRFDMQHPSTPVDNASFQKFAKILLKQNEDLVASMSREIEGLKDKVLQLEEEIEDDGERPRKG